MPIAVYYNIYEYLNSLKTKLTLFKLVYTLFQKFPRFGNFTTFGKFPGNISVNKLPSHWEYSQFTSLQYLQIVWYINFDLQGCVSLVVVSEPKRVYGESGRVQPGTNLHHAGYWRVAVRRGRCQRHADQETERGSA